MIFPRAIEMRNRKAVSRISGPPRNFDISRLTGSRAEFLVQRVETAEAAWATSRRRRMVIHRDRWPAVLTREQEDILMSAGFQYDPYLEVLVNPKLRNVSNVESCQLRAVR